MTQTTTATCTYTTVDIEKVVRRFSADIAMIAQSSGAISEEKARDYAHDVEMLAKKGYLSKVDLTLLSGQAEVRACSYTVNTTSNDLSMSRPGGVLWPRVTSPHLRITVFYTEDYDDAAKEQLKTKLKISWVTSTSDTSHSSLTKQLGRDYASNGWGLQRTDYGV